MEIDADFHVHSPFSGGVSEKMEIPVIAEQAETKGLDLIGTGDILHPEWRRKVEKQTEEREEGIFSHGDTKFILTTEVEDKNRVHHVIIFPGPSSVEQLYSQLSNFSSDIDKEGRPRVELDGEKIAEEAKKVDALIGPSHAFTPWTSIYKEHGSLESCYGELDIDFLELGLSADTELADKISEHNSLTFLSNSDSHSPWPHRIGREFNRIEVDKLSFKEIKKAIKQNKIKLNVGFNPREGKYHCSACQECYQKYSLAQARRNDWKCVECGGTVKKGVKDRIKELSDGGKSPNWRPEYMHLVPLAEIIKQVVGHSSVTTKKVQRIYDRYVEKFDSETDILVDEPAKKLKKVNQKVGAAVEKFREGKTVMVPGGGGEYGELIIPRNEEERRRIVEERESELNCEYRGNQKSLGEF
ncbi:MAG: TIGR00375 family protein [Candidatus Nanohaloarchaeota archaeon QJJ-9]|nr:TIGR00375 family protein [Candidatus Nanohaloarchaeota archaeon QJJ-9]